MGAQERSRRRLHQEIRLHILVWYELFEDINEAIAREKRMKRWNRAWKIKLIEKHNSGWNDIYEKLMGEIALPDIIGSL
jgi:predicted GIY-YIG superfamily endonuclease